MKLLNRETFAKRFEPSNTDLEYAIKNILEVYIRGQYYAIEHATYGERLNEKMGI